MTIKGNWKEVIRKVWFSEAGEAQDKFCELTDRIISGEDRRYMTAKACACAYDICQRDYNRTIAKLREEYQACLDVADQY